MMNPQIEQTLTVIGSRISPLVTLTCKAAIAPADTWTGETLEDRNPAVIEQLLPTFEWIYQHYFRVQTAGWEQIPDEPVLLVGSHNGGLAAPDTVMMAYDWFQRFGADRPAYALMDPRMWQALPAVARLAAQVGALKAEPQMAIAALRSGASLLIYPGGVKDVFRPYALRHQVCFYGHHGFVKLALEAKVPIVPLISLGAHSTLIILAEIYDQLTAISAGQFPWPFGLDPGVFPIYLGLPWGLGIGPLPNIPWPQPIHTRVLPPIRFERTGKEAARDQAYVDACYHQVQQTMQAGLEALVLAVEGPPSRFSEG